MRAGILEDRSDRVDVVGEIRRDATLSADQRQALIRIYQSFQAENSDADESTLDADAPDPESSATTER